MNIDNITQQGNESAQLTKETIEKEKGTLLEIGKTIINALKQGNKLLIAGNGGSAADAQHIAAELINTYTRKSKPLSAIALTTDTSTITAWANDTHYDYIFERQIDAHGKAGDIFLAITTSGNSQNLICAVKKAKEKGIKTISLLGKGGGKLKGESDHEIIVPSNSTPRIQETHHVIYHIICDIIEEEFLE